MLLSFNMPSPIDTSIFSYSRYIPVMQISDSKFDDFRVISDFYIRKVTRKALIRMRFYAQFYMP